MEDIINLLPDFVANQIAAGEVIQRPASAVKELMENSIDAGADTLKVIIKDSGKSLIQIIDNGNGMSEGDARMAFERHATSKIKNADDLFKITTMGFRGEALASIAAIAHVEIKTKRDFDEVGTQIFIEGSAIIAQEPCTTTTGTSINIKNIFYNVPARRNFLKSEGTETRNIINEFIKIALAYPEKNFTFHSDNEELYRLTSGNLKQRIIQIFGNSFDEKIMMVREETNLINIIGFVGKPQNAKKTRGDQFFFVNKRFIKSPYLNYAVTAAYEEMLPEGSFPFYCLFIQINPDQIDINIHPTKTEIKFINESIIHGIIKSAVRKSLGQFNIVPSLDFNTDPFLNSITPTSHSEIGSAPSIHFNPNYNPFGNAKVQQNLNRWESLYEVIENDKTQQTSLGADEDLNTFAEEKIEKFTFQWQKKFIVSPIKSGLMIIDQQAAHERILYERFSRAFENKKATSQQVLFPESLELNVNDFSMVMEMESELNHLGFDIRAIGKNSLIIDGIPADSENQNPGELFLGLIQNFKENCSEFKLQKQESLLRAMAKNSCIHAGKFLDKDEMNAIIDELFACDHPYHSPSGYPVVISLGIDEISKRFENKK